MIDVNVSLSRWHNRCVRDGPMVSIGEVEADKPCSVPEMDLIVERSLHARAHPPAHLAEDWR